MAAVYKQEFTVTIYSTEPPRRDIVSKKIRETLPDAVVVVGGSGYMVLALEDAARALAVTGTKEHITRLEKMVEAEDLDGVDTEGDEVTAVLDDDDDEDAMSNDFAAGLFEKIPVKEGSKYITSSEYNGPRWTYRADSVRDLYNAPHFIVASEQGHPGKIPFVQGDFYQKLTEKESREHSLTLVDWPGRIPDEEIEADYGFGGRKEIPDGYAPRTEDALRALIEHAIRTAPDELAGAITTAWAVYNQRGVEEFGQGTDSLPRLRDIIVFG